MKDERRARNKGRRGFVLALVASAAMLSSAAPATAGDRAEPLEQLTGTFVHAGGDAERRAVHDAIEEVVREMSPLVRSVARARLEEANPVPETLALRSDGKVFTMAYSEETYSGWLDGTPAKVSTRDGDSMQLRLRLENRTLRQVFTADDKSRTNLLRIEGGKLAVYVQVHASSLPHHLVYRLTYERRPAS
jgi:hypothetical protein